MLTIELLNINIPRLQLQDTVRKAIQLVTDFRVTHLPVITDGKFLGLVSEDDLLDAKDQKLPIEFLQEHFIAVSVKANAHFLNAVNIAIQYETNLIPVVGEVDEYMGVITTHDLLRTLGNFAGANEIGGIIVIEMERSQFAISEISRIVESHDCTIFHMNTTMHPETGLLTVTLHLNKKEVSSIVATFERYDFDVIYFYGNEKFENDIHSNYRHLMNYLDI